MTNAERKTVTLDATDKILGRFASQIAKELMGKTSVVYQPHIDAGASVVVANVGKLVVTGRKMVQKKYHHHTGHPGGLKTKTMGEMWAKAPADVLRSSVAHVAEEQAPQEPFDATHHLLNMAEQYFQAVGRRKSAVAQVRLYPGGSGTITVNEKPMDAYFTTPKLRAAVMMPLTQAGKGTTMNVTVRAVGGGQTGQADAVKLGIARALVMYDEELRSGLKAHSLLTRDPRKKERKKFGHRGARRSPQWRKR